MKTACVLLACAALLAVAMAEPLELSLVETKTLAVAGDDYEHCETCVELFDKFLEYMIEAVLEKGVEADCGEVCELIPSRLFGTVCDLACIIEGSKEFIQLVTQDAPNPLTVCQQLDLCFHTDSGVVSNVQAGVSPVNASSESFIDFSFEFTVVSATGPGVVQLTVFPPANSPGEIASAGNLNLYGFQPGVQYFHWAISRVPKYSGSSSSGSGQGSGQGSSGPFGGSSSSGAFAFDDVMLGGGRNPYGKLYPGQYTANLAYIEGSGDPSKPYSGIYASQNVTFSVYKAPHVSGTTSSSSSSSSSSGSSSGGFPSSSSSSSFHA